MTLTSLSVILSASNPIGSTFQIDSDHDIPHLSHCHQPDQSQPRPLEVLKKFLSSLYASTIAPKSPFPILPSARHC